MYKTRLLSLSAFCTKYQKSLLFLISAEDQSHPLGRRFRFCDYSNKPMQVSGHRPSVSGSRKAQKPTARKKAKQLSTTGCWFTLAEPQLRDSKSSARSSEPSSAHLYFQKAVYLVCRSHRHLFCLHIHSVRLPPYQSFQLHLEQEFHVTY